MKHMVWKYKAKRALAAGCLFTAGIPAYANVLTFEGDIASGTSDGSGPLITPFDGSPINQAYGDVPGVLDVSYIDRTPGLDNTSLRYWAADYNDLTSVAWGGNSDSNSYARIQLAVTSGTITLNGFDLGAYPHTSRETTLNVYEIGNPVALFTFTGIIGTGDVHSHFADPLITSVTSSTGFLIDWEQSAYNLGIDNVDFTLSAVPIPSTLLLLASALGGLLAARRRV